jgi:uncharacterized protein with ParB-like and HNH nuclease domain
MLFESPPRSLKELLNDIHSGKIQLPDFQRPWKWDDERILSLLATVTLGYPLGVVMTLTTGGSGTRFKPRPLEGAVVPHGTEPEELVMDGQQRLTSLYQALRSGNPVQTSGSRGQEISRWYYIDIKLALNPLAPQLPGAGVVMIGGDEADPIIVAAIRAQPVTCPRCHACHCKVPGLRICSAESV